MSKFHIRLKTTLKERKIKQSDFAKRIGVSQSAINKYCNGKTEPKINTLIIICKELGKTADYMLGKNSKKWCLQIKKPELISGFFTQSFNISSLAN